MASQINLQDLYFTVNSGGTGSLSTTQPVSLISYTIVLRHFNNELITLKWDKDDLNTLTTTGKITKIIDETYENATKAFFESETLKMLTFIKDENTNFLKTIKDTFRSFKNENGLCRKTSGKHDHAGHFDCFEGRI